MSVVSLSMEGAQGIASQLGALSTAIDTLAQKQAANTRATAAAARANTSAASSASQFTQTAQQGIQRVQGLASAIQGLVSQLGSDNRGAGLIASMAGTVAQGVAFGTTFGPGGAVIGGIAAAVGGLASLVRASEEVRAAFEEMNASTVESMRDVSHAIAGGDESAWAGAMSRAQAQMETLRERQAELRRESESTFNILFNTTAIAAARHELGMVEDEITALTAAIGDLSDEAARSPLAPRTETGSGAGGLGGGMATFLRLDAGLTRTETNAPTPERHRGGRRREAPERGAAMTEEALATFTDIVSPEEAARRVAADAARAAEAAQEAAALAERVRAEDAADFESWVERRRASAEAAMEASRAAAEADRDLKEQFNEFASGQVGSIGDVIAAYRELQTAASETGTTVRNSGLLMSRGMTAVGNQIVDVVGNDMTSAFSSALGAWLDGSKSFVEAAEAMAKGVIKALVQESIVQGVTELARGIADLASYHYDSAALHFAAAGAWAVVGGVAGGIGVATGAFGGGGAKDSGASQRDMADRDRERDRNAATSGAVVNLYMSGLAITQNDAAVGFARGVRQAQRAGYLPAGTLTTG